mmetsp:Transcript_13317/g.25097  ORF Transcript_13317/g.25097 Transcript_13317/m.25097 type:complete len:824 (-) Transcript_13317:45-2516(-)
MEAGRKGLRATNWFLAAVVMALRIKIPIAREAARPHFKWAQTNDAIIIVVPIPDLDRDSVSVTLAEHGGDCNISASDTTGTVSYSLELLLREDVSDPRWNLQPSRVPDVDVEVHLTLRKRFLHRWDQLVQKPSALKGYMEFDWTRGNESLEVDDEYDLIVDNRHLKRLTEANFHDTLHKHNPVVVRVRFPWCPACQRTDKIFAAVAKRAQAWRKSSPDTWGKTGWYVVDAREERNLGRILKAHCDRRQCGTIKVFTDADEEPETITGVQYTNDLVDKMEIFWKPAIHWLDSREAAAAIRRQSVTCLGEFTSSESFEYKLWKSAAKLLRSELQFCAVFGSAGTRVEMFHPNGSDVPEASVYDGVWTGNGTAILQWIRIRSVPLLQNRSWTNIDGYTRMQIPVARVWLDDVLPEMEQLNEKIRLVMRRLGQKYIGRVVFQENQRSAYSEDLHDFSLDFPAVFPAFAVDSTSVQAEARYALHLDQEYWINKRLQQLTTKFWSDEETIFKKLSEFIDDILAGKQPTTHHSALPQKYWSPGLIRRISWRELDEIRYPTKPLLLELYGSASRNEEGEFKEREVKALGHVLRPYANQFIMARYDGHFNYVPEDLFPGEGDHNQAVKRETSSKWYWITADPDPSRAGKPIVKRLMQPPQDATMKEVIQFLKRVSRADIWVDELYQQQQAQEKVLKRFKNFAKVEDLEAGKKGKNLLVQVVSKDPVEKTESGVRETFVVGDETGVVTMILESDEEHEHTREGKTIEIRNLRVEQADGKIYVTISKYGHIHPHDGEATIIPHTANDMSAIDHDLDDDFDDDDGGADEEEREDL